MMISLSRCKLISLSPLVFAPLLSAPAHAQDAVAPPPAALVMENVPPVPASVAAQVAKYTEFKPTGFTG